jgi:hypothetical protein
VLSIITQILCTDKHLQAKGVPCLRVKGSIYHNLGCILPREFEQPKFLQIFFYSQTEENISIPDMTLAEKRLLISIRTEIMRVNPFIQTIRDILDVTGALENNSTIPNYRFILSNEPSNGEHRGRYNLPSSTCVSAIVLGNEDSLQSSNRRVVVHMRSSHPSHIPSSHSAYDPLAYVLTHMHGDTGWTIPAYMPQFGLSTDDQKCPTLMEFYSYRAHTRDSLNGDIIFDSLLVGGQLMHQYWVDQWIKIEENRLHYIKHNQATLKAGTYDVICNAVNRNEADIGNWIILPSSFNGSPRNNVQNFQDLLAIQRKFGKPDYFITFTCNSKWTEIKENLKSNEQSWMRPDLSTRVFNMKLKKLISEICHDQRLGVVVAYTYVVEFQKRGLPHAHILIWVTASDKPRTIEDFDAVVSAEIPDPTIYPKLHEIVSKNLIHGPCGSYNPRCVCMENGRCKKNFPKDFCDETVNPEDGYPVYMRRSPEKGGHTLTLTSNMCTIDNRWVVPYNPYLTKRFNAHINVEICNTVQVLKYLFKYVYKGHDKISEKWVVTGFTLTAGW